MKSAAHVTVWFLSAIAVLHVLRVIFQVPVTAGKIEIPMWASVVAIIAVGALAVWLWKEQK